MPIFFFIDKDFMDDPTMRDIDDVVLSYTFFKCASRLHILIFFYPDHFLLPGREEMSRDI